MTKKDYILIASVISNWRIDPEVRFSAAKEFAKILSQEFPRFNEVKFIDACK